MIVKKILRKIIYWTLEEPVKYGALGENSIVAQPNMHDSNQSHVYIGDNTVILKNSRIQLYPERVEKEPNIYIGNGCYLGFNLTLLAGGDITIEDNVLMASNVMISSENHGINPELSIPYMEQKLIGKEVVIGEGTWLGEKVCVMPGVHIGKKCIVGAGSVVTKDIPDYCIAVGSPARIVKKYDFDEHEWKRV